MTPVNEKLRASLEDWIRQQRDKYGEEVANELIRAYLTGVNDTIQIVSEFGAAMSYTLRAALEGN